jgi:hypothetical protein
MTHVLSLLIVLAIVPSLSYGYSRVNYRTYNSPASKITGSLFGNQKRYSSSTQLGLFQGLFGGGKPKSSDSSSITAPSAGKVADAAKLKEMKSNLAKIGNTQKRDYDAEAKARAPPPKQILDKQTLSFNFNKPNEFPNLFKGKRQWLVFYFYVCFYCFI